MRASSAPALAAVPGHPETVPADLPAATALLGADVLPGWTDTWPPDPTQPAANPAAVALWVRLAGPGLSGELRRIALLPAEVAP